MLQKRDHSTFLRKLNPGAKLLFAMGLIFSVILFKNLYYSGAIMVVSFILIIREKQLTLFKFVLWTMTVLFVAMYGIYGAIAPNIDKLNDPVFFSIIGINYYLEGFAYASRFYFRVAPLMCALFLTFLSIDTTDLGVTMCKLGIPYHFVFTFIDSFQVIALLRKDMEQIQDAQRARGLNTEGNLFQRFKAFVPIMVPVVANSIIKVQDQAIAMDTKGFNSTCTKTIYRELDPCKLDAPVAVLGIMLAIVAVLYKILIFTSVIPPFLTNII